MGIEFKVENDPVLDRDNVAIALAVQAIADQSITIVATTHILFNPRRGDVKLAQCQRLLECIEQLQQKHCPAEPRVIICGDFNFTPCSPLYSYFSTGALDCSQLKSSDLSCQIATNGSFFHTRLHHDEINRHQGGGAAAGKYTITNATEKKGFHLEYSNKYVGKNATHSLTLKSAYAQEPTDNTTGEPLFTTYHERFYGTVDYIWYTTPTLTCTGVMEMPKNDDFFRRIRSLPTQLLREILTWAPDVICLQEVDHFDDYFETELASHGYEGKYQRRTGETTLDGCAIFIRSATFTIVEEMGIEFKVENDPVLD
ncbi:hypothetical protein THRCLA_00248, partial [Thraustotheca clavata]